MSKYYSQNGEDFLLCNLFNYKKSGFYVDVGAFDGVHLSNSYSFEQQGWSGICVEPHPAYFQLCKQLRPRAISLNVACVANDEVDTIDFYAEELGLLSGMLGDRESDVRSRYEERGIQFKGFNRILVPASTLNALLDKYLPPETEIDFISIDVEGTELEVLQGLDLSRFQTRVLVVEANSQDVKDSLDKHLVQLNGYVEARNLGQNIFYAKNSKDIDKIRTISIHCQIEKNLHPLGEKYTLRQFIEGKAIHEHNKVQKTHGFAIRRIRDKLLALLRA